MGKGKSLIFKSYAILLIGIASLSPAGSLAQGTPCGTRGTLQERIQSCNHTCTYTDRAANQNHHWQLVTKTHRGHQVWYDQTNRQVWSDNYDHSLDYRSGYDICRRSYDDDFKGGLNSFFELPRASHIQMAERAGIEHCLPKFQFRYWISNGSEYGQRAQVYDAFMRAFFSEDVRVQNQVRCVGF